MMLIGRPSGRENLLCVTGVEPMHLIRTHLCTDRNRHHANSALTQGRRPHMTQAGPCPKVFLGSNDRVWEDESE
jgi:hypothetical protein